MQYCVRNLLFILMVSVFSISTTESLTAQKKLLKPGRNAFRQPVISSIQAGAADTLKNNMNYDVMFTASGQDVLAAWFVCPADLKIKACGYDCGNNPAGANIELKIVKVSSDWTLDMLQRYGSEQIGYWQGADSFILPFANAAPGQNLWVPVNELASPFTEDIWSDGGVGAPDKPEDDGDRSTYQWIEMNIIGYEPELHKGDIFAVCIKNTEPAGSENNISMLASNESGYGVMKFYANGRVPDDPGTAGWWQREYMLNIAAAVELTGDNPPVITDIQKLETTLSTAERKVFAIISDDNPSGGQSGIDSAAVQYFLNDDSTWIEVSMTDIGEGKFEGIIPGQNAGTKVTYRIQAMDILGNESVSEEMFSYFVFGPSPEVKSLLVLNGFNEKEMRKISEINYFGSDDFVNNTRYEWIHDVWYYGALTEELLNNYTNIIEITNSGDAGSTIIYNDEVIKEWLRGGTNRNYALAGQEWLGARYGFADQDFTEGSFEYDILGITHVYNDVADTTEFVQPSRLFPLQGSLLSEAIYTKFGEMGIDSLQYDPWFEIKTGNWIDGFDVVAGQDVDMEVETQNIAGEIKSEKLTCITHRVLPSGNKIVFISFDPLAINTSPYSSKYYKFGLSQSAPQVKVLQWFDVQTDVNEKKTSVPLTFYLFQNYPNPFNPVTRIDYSIPLAGLVSLKVYNLLGEEVITLVDESKQPGVYNITFDAAQLSSGIYYYLLKTADFTASKKMIVLK